MSPARGWVAASTGIRQAFQDMIGRTQHWIVPATVPTFEELLEQFGSTSAIAEAAGFGTARNPRRGGRSGRESFMRSLRRYRQGTRLPSAERQRLIQGLALRERRKQATPRDMGHLANLVLRHGFTLHGTFTVDISSTTGVVRVLTPPGWFVTPRIVDEEGLAYEVAGRHWRRAVEPFSNCFSRSYLGSPGMVIREVEYLFVSVGQTRGAQLRER